MIPIKLQKDGSIYELGTEEFSKSIIEVCEKHRKEKRALAFAFILYNVENPQIVKILNDKNYWNALNTISGHYLSIYYINSQEHNFGEDLANIKHYEKRALFQIDGKNDLSAILPMLKNYLELDQDVKIPSILFFQVEGALISDYFLIELSEEKIEESFLELRDYIVSAVDRLRMIDRDNYGNFQPIFESLKQGVKSKRFRKVLFKNVQTFPVQLLISWVVGKV